MSERSRENLWFQYFNLIARYARGYGPGTEANKITARHVERFFHGRSDLLEEPLEKPRTHR